jgi:hypothetical protein
MWQAMLMGPVLPEAMQVIIGERAASLLSGVGIAVEGPMHLGLRDWLVLLPCLLAMLVLAMILPNGHALGERVHEPANPTLATSRRYALAVGSTAALLVVDSLIYLSYNPFFLYFQF